MFYSFRDTKINQLHERIGNMLRVKKNGFAFDLNAGFDWFKYNDPLEARSLNADLINYILTDSDVFSAKIDGIEQSDRKVLINLTINHEKLEGVQVA